MVYTASFAQTFTSIDAATQRLLTVMVQYQNQLWDQCPAQAHFHTDPEGAGIGTRNEPIHPHPHTPPTATEDPLVMFLQSDATSDTMF